MTVNPYTKRTLAAAVLAAALTTAPAGVLAAETAPQVPGSQTAQETIERLSPFGRPQAYRGVSVSSAWLRQARLNGVLLNLRLHTPMGDEVVFREMIKAAPSDVDTICLYLQAKTDSEVISMQMDQEAMDTLRRLGVSEVVVADAERYVRAHYQVSELQAVRDTLGLERAEQLCVSGEDAPVTVVSEDGVRRQVN